jgi:hypothetical protein
MPGRGPQTFKKRQKEQQRKERSQEKFAKRMQRKAERAAGISHSDDSMLSSAEPHESATETSSGS